MKVSVVFYGLFTALMILLTTHTCSTSIFFTKHRGSHQGVGHGSAELWRHQGEYCQRIDRQVFDS